MFYIFFLYNTILIFFFETNSFVIIFRCNLVPELRAMMNDEEKTIASTSCSDVITMSKSLQAQPTKICLTESMSVPLNRWNDMKGKSDAIKCPSMDELIKVIGLQKAKAKALDMYNVVISESKRPPDRRRPQSHNFVIQGNNNVLCSKLLLISCYCITVICY